MSEPREKTKEEVVTEFLEHMQGMVRYWDRLDKSPRDKLEGLLFSMLTTIDGCSAGMCGLSLTPSFHPDDPEFLKGEGEDWYPTCVINDEVHLHELYCALRKGSS
jgi:hypothetical protein